MINFFLFFDKSFFLTKESDLRSICLSVVLRFIHINYDIITEHTFIEKIFIIKKNIYIYIKVSSFFLHSVIHHHCWEIINTHAERRVKLT